MNEDEEDGSGLAGGNKSGCGPTPRGQASPNSFQSGKSHGGLMYRHFTHLIRSENFSLLKKTAALIRQD